MTEALSHSLNEILSAICNFYHFERQDIKFLFNLTDNTRGQIKIRIPQELSSTEEVITLISHLPHIQLHDCQFLTQRKELLIDISYSPVEVVNNSSSSSSSSTTTTTTNPSGKEDNTTSSPDATPAGPVVADDDDDTIVNPWSVESEGAINYDRLIVKFGSQAIDSSLLERIERVIGRKPHRFLRRGLFFSHRDLHQLLDLYEKGEKFYLYTGRGPSSEALHLGHAIPFHFTKVFHYFLDIFLSLFLIFILLLLNSGFKMLLIVHLSFN